jgi:membrane protein CcdC involved in cytochrome C biogenesis
MKPLSEFRLSDIHPAILVLASIAGAIAVLTWRFRETRTPVSIRKIVIPPLGMSTGFCMFIAPETRVPLLWAGVAFFAGVLVFYIPLARSSRLTKSGDIVLMQRSRAFLWILLGLFAVRFVLRAWLERFVTPIQTGALAFVLAFGMILRWRLAMLHEFLRLRTSTAVESARAPSSVAQDP